MSYLELSTSSIYIIPHTWFKFKCKKFTTVAEIQRKITIKKFPTVITQPGRIVCIFLD